MTYGATGTEPTMSGPVKQCFDSLDALGDWLVPELRGACARSEGRLLALAVGNSTLPLYAGLDPAAPEFRDCVAMPIDELRPRPRDAARSFSAQLRAALPAGWAARFFDLETATPDALAQRVGRDGLAAVVLGLGPDGHVAMNQPGSALDAACREVAIAPENLARMGPVAPATSALTLGLAELWRADEIFLVAAGRGKAEATARIVDGPADPAWPASLLRDHPGLHLLCAELG